MSAALSVVSQQQTETRGLERDLARSRGQLLGLIGAAQVVAVANEDFRTEVRAALTEGRLTVEHFDQLNDVLDAELQSLSAAGEQLLDEELRAVLP